MGFLADRLGDWIMEEIDTDQAAYEGFDAALGACGNSGQESIIMDMEGSFMDAAEAAANGGSAYSVLVGDASYPEAITVILQEAAATIEQALEEYY